MQQLGLTVRKASPDLLLVVHMFSPDGTLDQQYVANYATLHILDELLRVEGVGDIRIRGARDYAMRVWIDPNKAAARGLTADDIVTALRSHNVDVAAGTHRRAALHRRAARLSALRADRRAAADKAEFEDIVLKTDAQNRITRVDGRGAGRAGRRRLHGQLLPLDKTAVTVPIQQQPGANALKTAGWSRRRCSS